jgi:cyclomaltodextrinase / maltogenic alpha-amylase / neopullulanase
VWVPNPTSPPNKNMNQEIKIGKYEHYKGKQYEVIGLARHSETLEELVVYKALYGEGDLWVRPADMFTETVEIEGETKPRFKYIGE